VTYIETFTQSKEKGNPASNEDRVVAVPDRLYAVIDGATDKSGLKHAGLTGGQIVGRILEDVIRGMVRDSGGGEAQALAIPALLRRVNRRLQRFYRASDLAGAIRRDPWRRFAAQLSIAVKEGDRYRFAVIGNTGLRVNGQEVFSAPQPGEEICAQLRAAVYRHLIGRGADRPRADDWARAYTVEGLKAPLPRKMLDAEALGRLRHEASAECLERFPAVGAETIESVLTDGLKGLHRYRNRRGPLGFPSIDGSPIPEDMIIEFERPAAEVHCIEIFSDGYPGIPDGTAVRDWESRYAEAERDDPERISIYPDVKGSAAGRFADDRTVLIVRPRAPT
jgi:hypothetical protein